MRAVTAPAAGLYCAFQPEVMVWPAGSVKVSAQPLIAALPVLVMVMLAVSLLYVLGRGVPVVDGALFGIKAAVLVIVVEALIRIGRRSLKSRLLIGVAALAFIGIFFFSLPFPSSSRWLP